MSIKHDTLSTVFFVNDGNEENEFYVFVPDLAVQEIFDVVRYMLSIILRFEGERIAAGLFVSILSHVVNLVMDVDYQNSDILKATIIGKDKESVPEAEMIIAMNTWGVNVVVGLTEGKEMYTFNLDCLDKESRINTVEDIRLFGKMQKTVKDLLNRVKANI